MTATLTVLSQVIEVTEVGQITISEIVQDPDDNNWVREIKVFGEADPVSGVRLLLFTLRMTATDEDYLQLQAPTQLF